MGNYYVGSLFYLSHSGIKGQKWGVKRFQNADRTWTDEGKIRYGRKSKGVRKASNTDEGSKGKSISKSSEEPVDPNKVDRSDLPQYLLRLGVDVAGMALGNPYSYANFVTDLGRGAVAATGNVTAKLHEKERENESIDERTGFHLKSSEMTDKEDLARVNPEVNNFNSGTKSNCMLCTAAYEMRRRGYDVKAETASYGYEIEDVKKWFPKAEIKTIIADDSAGIADRVKAAYGMNRKKMLDAIAQLEADQPEGARGNLMVEWGTGGGHSMVYDIKDGKMRILDGQINKIYSDDSRFQKPISVLGQATSFTYVRLDNVDFDPERIKECCR